MLENICKERKKKKSRSYISEQDRTHIWFEESKNDFA